MAAASRKSSSTSNFSGQADTTLLRRLNEGKVIDALRNQGSLTRAGLVRHTGLSHPTVTKIVDALCAASILEEGELEQPEIGRPARVVALARLRSRVLSLVVGVNRCSLISAGLDGVLAEGNAEIFPTPDSYAKLIKRVVAHLKALPDGETACILGLGICLPGLLDSDNEKVLLCPNLTWLEGRRPGLDLTKRLGIPVAQVQAMAAHGLFESRYGGAWGMEDFVVINYAGGLGAAACSRGELVSGSGGLAGELGHITVDAEGELCGCGNRGCLETIASDRAVLLAASKQLGKVLTMSEMIERVEFGSGEFDDILERAGRYLAIGLAAAVNIFNPQAIFIYGKFLGVQQGLFDRVVEWVGERALQLPFSQCEIFQLDRDPHECQQIGAAAAIIEKLTRSATQGATSD